RGGGGRREPEGAKTAANSRVLSARLPGPPPPCFARSPSPAARRRNQLGKVTSVLKNRRGRVLDDKADLGNRARHGLADQIQLAELLDAGGRLIDLLGCQHEAQ